MASKDHYEVLDATSDATQEELKRCFQRLALETHPDKNKDPNANAIFAAVNNAWAVLGDPSARAEYDQRKKEVDIDEMTFKEELGTYTWACRCGDCYVIDEDELATGAEIVGCGGCSLAIRVIYECADSADDADDADDADNKNDNDDNAGDVNEDGVE